MNRRDFITKALTFGAVAGVIGITALTSKSEITADTFSLAENTLEGLLKRLIKQPNQRIAVVMDFDKSDTLVKSLLKNDRLSNYAIEATWRQSRVLFPNDTTVFIYDINNPSALRGPQFHTGILVGKPKYPDAKAMLEFCLRLGDSPVLFELK